MARRYVRDSKGRFASTGSSRASKSLKNRAAGKKDFERRTSKARATEKKYGLTAARRQVQREYRKDARNRKTTANLKRGDVIKDGFGGTTKVRNVMKQFAVTQSSGSKSQGSVGAGMKVEIVKRSKRIAGGRRVTRNGIF